MRVFGWGLSLERPTMIKYKACKPTSLVDVETNASVGEQHSRIAWPQSRLVFHQKKSSSQIREDVDWYESKELLHRIYSNCYPRARYPRELEFEGDPRKLMFAKSQVSSVPTQHSKSILPWIWSVTWDNFKRGNPRANCKLRPVPIYHMRNTVKEATNSSIILYFNSTIPESRPLISTEHCSWPLKFIIRPQSRPMSGRLSRSVGL